MCLQYVCRFFCCTCEHKIVLLVDLNGLEAVLNGDSKDSVKKVLMQLR